VLHERHHRNPEGGVAYFAPLHLTLAPLQGAPAEDVQKPLAGRQGLAVVARMFHREMAWGPALRGRLMCGAPTNCCPIALRRDRWAGWIAEEEAENVAGDARWTTVWGARCWDTT